MMVSSSLKLGHSFFGMHAPIGQSIPTIPPKQRFQFSLDIP